MNFVRQLGAIARAAAGLAAAMLMATLLGGEAAAAANLLAAREAWRRSLAGEGSQADDGAVCL